MARTSNPSGKIPHVWDNPVDDFLHAELEANWDAIDAELTRLDGERMPLGSVVMWWRRGNTDPNIPWSTGSVWQPCDGRTILAANHDFPGGGNLVLPDMRNMVPVGAASPDGGGNPALTYPGDGVEVNQNDGPTNAGGINGTLGGMGKITVPNHYHDHPHAHQIGTSSNRDETTVARQPDDGGAYSINTDASGSGHTVALTHHTHQLLQQYTSNARDDTNANKRLIDISGNDPSQTVDTSTTLQKASTGGTADSPTGGTTGDALSLDTRPAARGLIFIMKVKNSV